MKNDKADLEGHIRKSIWDYPTLYRSFDWETSRLHVLGHIFVSYGTALEWHPDGFLTYLDYDEKSEDGYEPVQSLDKLPDEFFTKDLWYIDVLDTRKKEIEEDLDGVFFYWQRKENNSTSVCVFESDKIRAKELKVKYLNPNDERDKRIIEMAKEMGRNDYKYIGPSQASSFDRKCKSESVHYPKTYIDKTYIDGYSPGIMCQYSPIVEMINNLTNSSHIENFKIANIRPDWIKGAIDISRYCLEWYKNTDNYKYDYYYPDGKPNEFYERDPAKYRAGCQNPELGVVFADEMTIEEYTWASWEYHLKQQTGWFERLIKMYA
jgi:hypothetical protein